MTIPIAPEVHESPDGAVLLELHPAGLDLEVVLGEDGETRAAVLWFGREIASVAAGAA